MLILAGVTINALFGENGLLNRATGAKEEYSKGEVKEKVELLLSEYTIEKTTGENTDFAKFLRKNLQVGVAQNEDDTYAFMLGEWQVVATENEVISIEKFKLDVDKTYPNVASMRADTGLTDGQLVRTESYWDKQYGGSAYYDIVNSTSLEVDDGKCIQLDNGLYAELHPINDTVTVNQFGAYGDREHDDAMAIENTLNTGFENINFESAQYGMFRDISIASTDIYINLQNSEVKIIANNQFENASMFNFWNSNNIYINKIKFDSNKEQNINNAIGGITFWYCKNIEINSCDFYGTGEEATGITSVSSDEYTIENCNFFSMDCGFMTIGATNEDNLKNFI